MRNGLGVKTYGLPPVDKKEVLRYAGYHGETDEHSLLLLEECIAECEVIVGARICYLVLGKAEFFNAIPEARESNSLQRLLSESEKVLVFAGTVGLELDRLMERYACVSPAKSLLIQAIGAERIETLCELFCEELRLEYAKDGYVVGKRFSPGYGDFSLQAQEEIFRILDCPRKIGLTLTNALLMSPTKSVTAIVGLQLGNGE